MTTRVPGSSSAGEQGEAVQGPTGEGPAPVGGTRVVIGMMSQLLCLLCVVLAVVRGQADGVLLLGTVFLAVFLWAIGAYRRSFWVD